MRKVHKLIVLLCLVVAVAFVGVLSLLALRLFFFNYSQIPQDGMFPSMPAGTRIISRRRPYRDINQVKRGDVVIFTRDLDGQTFKCVWRVVGLPGDQVEIADDAVKINGLLLKHEQVRQQENFSIVREWNGEASYEIAYDQSAEESQKPHASLTVPPDQVFVLGDNRRHAQDSIYNGPIPFSSIVEKRVF